VASDYDRPLSYYVAAYAADVDRDVVDMVSGEPDWDPLEALRAGLREYADAPPAAFQYPPARDSGSSVSGSPGVVTVRWSGWCSPTAPARPTTSPSPRG
jgi:hypothetical protein